MCFPLKKAHFFTLPLPFTTSLRNSWAQRGTMHVQEIAAGFLTRPVSGVAASCVQQAGQNAQALKICVTQHAVTMGLNDTFLVVLVGCAICAVLALFLGRDPAIEAAKAAKKRGETVEETPPVTVMSE